MRKIETTQTLLRKIKGIDNTVMLVGKKYILIKIQTMKKNEIEDLLLSEMEEVNGGSGSSTCVCDYGELAKLSCLHQFQMNLKKVGWNVKMWVCQE